MILTMAQVKLLLMGKNGYLIKANDIDAFAKAMIKLRSILYIMSKIKRTKL